MINLGEFIYKFLLGCIKQTCYAILKKGTIYIYNSKRSYLNNPQKPKTFYNLNISKSIRNGHYLTLTDPYNKIILWNIN
jgi:hypothetical protein